LTSDLVLAGLPQEAIQQELGERLGPSFPDSSLRTRGSLSKTITILTKTWIRVPKGLDGLRDRGLELLRTTPGSTRRALHWGMLTAAYPFWGAVAGQTGRLLRLQSELTTAQVQRRLREVYGQRETVFRRVRYVIQACVDWEVLRHSEGKGTYLQCPQMHIEDADVVGWLCEAILHSRQGDSAPVVDLLDSPSLFPFKFHRHSAEALVRATPGLDVFRHSLESELLILK
jgi:hypothetical protein